MTHKNKSLVFLTVCYHSLVLCINKTKSSQNRWY